MLKDGHSQISSPSSLQRFVSLRAPLFFSMVLLCACVSCSSAKLDRFRPDLAQNDSYTTGEPFIDYDPHPQVDRLERTFEWLPKKIGVGRRVTERDEITPETLSLLKAYMEEQGLGDIPIVINEYSPRRYWQRVKEGRTLSVGWRYTGGAIGWLKSSLIPIRAFDRNHYDPASNSLYVNSNNPFDLLSELAYARQLREKSWRGTRMAIRSVKLVNQIARIDASREALQYAGERNLWELEKQGYRRVYSEYCMVPLLAAGPFLPWYANPVLRISSVTAGSALAKYKIRKLETERGNTPDGSHFPEESQQDVDEIFVQSLFDELNSKNHSANPIRPSVANGPKSPAQLDRIEIEDQPR